MGSLTLGDVVLHTRLRLPRNGSIFGDAKVCIPPAYVVPDYLNPGPPEPLAEEVGHVKS
jgi:hypothetical protein